MANESESASAVKANPMRYIQRVDNRHHAWKVSMKRFGQYFHQYFTDSTHGGMAQALTAAVAWRGVTRRWRS